jgi:hypothetical protein
VSCSTLVWLFLARSINISDWVCSSSSSASRAAILQRSRRAVRERKKLKKKHAYNFKRENIFSQFETKGS